MLLNMIKQTPWEFLKDYISPSFFKVIPISILSKEALSLALNVKSKNLLPIKKDLNTILNQLNIEIGEAKNNSKNSKSNKELAELILKLYFTQIIYSQNILLDIRHENFSWEKSNRKWIWTPHSLFIKWKSDFSQSIKDIYDGYYTGDDHLFTEGLKKLNLYPCKDLFKQHFGFGNQTQVEFKQENFYKIFHEIFLECKKHNIKLHSNFISLGLFLALLYESLEKLNVTLDVRKSYLDVKQLISS